MSASHWTPSTYTGPGTERPHRLTAEGTTPRCSNQVAELNGVDCYCAQGASVSPSYLALTQPWSRGWLLPFHRVKRFRECSRLNHGSQRHQVLTLEPVKCYLYGQRDIPDVIKVRVMRWRLPRIIQMGPKYSWCSYMRRAEGDLTQTGDSNVTMKAETGVMWLQAKDTSNPR